jgi:hypothetical protein
MKQSGEEAEIKDVSYDCQKYMYSISMIVLLVYMYRT